PKWSTNRVAAASRMVFDWRARSMISMWSRGSSGNRLYTGWGVERPMRSVIASATLVLALTGLPAVAQWIDYPTAGIPRTKDGKANLSAPAPKTSDGRPDLSGIWKASSGKYLADLAADGIDVGMLP